MDLEIFNLDEKDILKNADVPDGMILREMNACFTSSDAHTPMSPMRTTQTNIGLQLVKEDASAERYGVSKEQYGGVGPKYIKNPRYMNTPRTIWHARTGLHEEIPPSVSPHNRDLMVQKNKSMFASPVNEVGADAYNLWYNNFVDSRAKEVTRSLFPRSIVYELEYIKNENHKVMLAALEMERQAFEEKKMRKRNQAAQNTIDQETKKNPPLSMCQTKEVDACGTAPPFWWNDPSGRLIQPGPEPQTGDFLYTANQVSPAIERPDVVRDMQLDDAQEYTPGEIYKGAKVPLQMKKQDGRCSIAEWRPKDENFHKSYDPGQVQGNLAGRKLDTQTIKDGSSKVQSRGQTLESTGDCVHSLGCQCHNELVHRHLGHVATSTPHRPVVPLEKEEAAEVTAGGCMSVSGICGCESFKQGQRMKTDKTNVNEHDFPGTEIRYSPYGEQERQNELFKVGVPFKAQAAKWMDMNKDPLPPRPPPKQPSPWKE